MYTCVIHLRDDLVEVSIYDDKGKLSKYEKVDLRNKLIEISSKYVRLVKSELSNAVIAVCQIDDGLIKIDEGVLRIT